MAVELGNNENVDNADMILNYGDNDLDFAQGAIFSITKSLANV